MKKCSGNHLTNHYKFMNLLIIPKQHRKPETVYLDFTFEDEENSNTSLFLSKRLWSQLITTTQLHLNIMKPFDSSGFFQKLGQELTKLHNLKHFKLPILKDTLITDKELVTFGSLLLKSKHLKCLDLNFSWWNTLTDSGVMKFSKSLEKLSKMEFFKLNLENCLTVSDHGFAKLINSLQSFSHLKDLALDFSQCRMISDKTILNLANLLDKRANLQKFSLVLVNCKNISTDSIVKIGESLERNKDLLALTLNFSGWSWGALNINNLKRLGVSISKVSTLQHLRLVLKRCRDLDDDLAENFLKSLAQLRNLKTMNLDFAECLQLGTSRFDTFSHIFDELINLEELELNLRKCPQISDIEIKNLAESLLPLLKMTKITLIIAETDNITNQGLIKLTTSLNELKKLKSIVLLIDHCKAINNEGIDFFVKCIQNHIEMEYLRLNFARHSNIYYFFLIASSCVEIDNSVLINCAKALSMLPVLKEVQISAWNTLVNETGKQEFINYFQNSSVLVTVEI